MRRSFIISSFIGLALASQSSAAQAFCGFYVAGADAKLFNDATQVVLMREGTRTVLSMQNNYKGPAEDFAMVVPVPTVLSEDNVKILPPSVFERVDKLSSPRLVEYWERDPCEPEYRPMPKSARRSMAMGAGAVAAERKSDEDFGVKVEARFEVGEYEIVILSAEDSLGLYDWLGYNKYKIPDGAAAVLEPYVTAGMKFFVAKVSIDKVAYDKSGMTKLSPLRFHYESESFNLPVRLGLLNSQGTQDLIVYILARNQRYQVANYRNVFIPTNLLVRNRTKAHFARFYTSLFDGVMRENPRAVVTEYSWQATKCDPCPGPDAALSGWELASLGADVLGGAGVSQPMPRGRRGRPVQVGSNFVLTRLHTRYTKKSLGEDLIFEAAAPVVGGREVYNGRRVEHGASESSMNNFQARYIIRHRWAGKVSCDNPRFGRWGGPPNDAIAESSGASTAVATNLGLQKKRKVNIGRYLLQSAPEAGFRYKSAKKKSK